MIDDMTSDMPHTVTLSSGRSYSVLSEDVSLLDAAEASSVVLPYSCRTGRCSSCRARVRSGQTVALSHEEGLDPADREAGYILTCVRSPRSDIELDILDLTGLSMPPVSRFPCRIDKIEMCSSSVARLILRIPPKDTFSFLPGQYIDLAGPDGLKRSYSVAAVEPSGKKLHLLIKRVVGGAMSTFLFETARENALMNFTGPLGTFFLREAEGRDLVFLATGTGIAPVVAMLDALKSGPAPASIRVFWGGRHAEDIFLNIAALAPKTEFTPVLSRGEVLSGFVRGHVQDVFLNDHPDLSKTDVYACGSENMIRSARRALVAAGLPQSRFYSDAFVSSS